MASPTRDRELWALAIAVEREHGGDGPRVIAEKIGAFALSGEAGAVEMWRGVAERYARLIGRS